MKKLLIVVAACLIALPCRAEKSAFRIADFYRLKSISNLSLAPDGKRVAFTVTSYNLEEGKKKQMIWLLGTDGKGLTQLTSGEHHDYSPVWSPDGKTIAFLSDRTGSDALHLISPDGGEARKLTDISTGINNPIWSPDGSSIIFTSDVYPECGANDLCNKDIEETRDKGPLKAHMADALLYRRWNFWKDGRVSHILQVDLDGKVKDLTPGPYDSPVFYVGAGPEYDVSLDGKLLALASNRAAHPAETTNADIFLESLKTEITENSAEDKTQPNEAADSGPLFSPDGKTIAYKTQRVPGYEADLWRLGLLDVGTGKTRLLTDTGNFDYWVNQLVWSRDSKTIYFTAQVSGETPIYRVDVGSGKIEKIVSHATIDSFALDPQERFVVAIRRAIAEPWEIYRYDIASNRPPEKISSFNQGVVDEVDIRPAERLSVPGAAGKPVDVFLIKPHNFDPQKKYPLILNIHGGPQMQWQDSFRGDWQVYPGSGYVVAFPNPHGSTGYGQAYTDAIAGDYGGKVYDDIMKVADRLAALPYIDKERMGVMGWSWGGYMVDWLLGHTNRFKCLASMMGIYDLRSKYGGTEELWFPEWDQKGTPWTSPLYEKWSPSNFVPSFKTPTLIITGEKDYRVPYTQSLQLFTALQKMRVPSRLIVFPESGHWPSWYEMSFYFLAHLDWFHRYLGGDAPPWKVEDYLRNGVFKKPKETGS